MRLRVFLFAACFIIACRSERIAASPLEANRIVVDKSDRTLTLYLDDRVVKTYRVALGRTPVGAKEQEGDGRTPEGSYTIDYRNPNSLFHRSLHVSYPTPAQRREARRRGVSPGGDIMIHGLPNGRGKLGAAHRLADWTDGCIAVTNEEIDEIWNAVEDGTPIVIRP